MGRLFKIVGWLLGLLAVLLIAAVLILPMVFDPNDYKDEIAAKVHEQTGRDLQIDGDLKLSVFPWLGVEIGGVRLSNASGFGDQPFIVVKDASVRVKLMPLLSKQVEVDRLVLDGLVLNLAKQKDGRTNWDDLTGAESDAEGAKPKETTEEKAESSGLEALTIGGIDIRNASVEWSDASTGRHFNIVDLDLHTGELVPGQPVDLELAMQIKSDAPKLQARIDMGGTVALDERAKVVDVSGLKLTLDASGKDIPGGGLKLVLETAVRLAMSDNGTLDVKGLKLSAGELLLTGDLHGSGLSGVPAFSGRLRLAEFNLRQWLEQMGIALPPMADAKALTLVGARLDLDSKGDTTRLHKMAIRLDDSRIDGDLTIEGKAARFNLQLDAIDLDRYLPAAKEDGAAAKPAAGKAATTPASAARNKKGGGSSAKEPPLLPVDTLRELDLDGTIGVGRLIVSKLVAEKIQVTVKARKGRIEIGQQIGGFYQGGYKGKVKLDVSGKTPLSRIDADAKGIQIGPLLKDMTGKDLLTGKGRFHAQLNTRGNSVAAFKRTLGGKLNFRFEDGALKGINLAQLIRETKARFKGQPVAKSTAPQQTDFSEVSGSAVITKGILRNKDLLAKTPFLRVKGRGQVDLVQESLDYTVTAVVVNTLKGQGGEGLDKLKGINIPVRLTGPYAAPEYSIDWGKILVESQKGKLKEKLKEKLKDKLPAGLGEGLKGLFN